MPRLGEVPLIPWGGCELGEGCVGVGGSGTAARRLLKQQLQRFKKKKNPFQSVYQSAFPRQVKPQ